jgi:hypothetical protein
VPEKTTAESVDLTRLNFEQVALIEACFSMSGRNPTVLSRMSVSAQNALAGIRQKAIKQTMMMFFMHKPFI